MLVTLNAGAPVSTINAILAAATAAGCESRTFDDGHGGTVVGVAGTVSVAELPGVNAVLEQHRPYMLASREGRPHAPTVVKVGGVRIGGGRPVVIGGPCVIEGQESLLEASRAMKAAGADMLRGGAFKPRTSPYAFQGLGEEGLCYLAEERRVCPGARQLGRRPLRAWHPRLRRSDALHARSDGGTARQRAVSPAHH